MFIGFQIRNGVIRPVVDNSRPYTKKTVLAVLDQFKGILDAADVQLLPNCPAARELELARQLMTDPTAVTTLLDAAHREQIESAGCAFHVADLVVKHCGSSAEVRDKLAKHFKLLESCSLKLAAQTPQSDGNNRKLLELLVALGASAIGSDLEVDHPTKPDGANPDVMVTIGGKRWGFACKAPHSGKPQTLFDRFAEGVEQLNQASIDHGLVVMSAKNLFSIDDWLPVNDKKVITPRTANETTEKFTQRVCTHTDDMSKLVSTPAEHQKDAKAHPFVCWLGHRICVHDLVVHPAGPTVVAGVACIGIPYSMCRVADETGLRSVVERLHHALAA